MRKWRNGEKQGGVPTREVWVLGGSTGGGTERRREVRGTGLAQSSLLGLPGSPK